jgi:hypothetical protein
MKPDYWKDNKVHCSYLILLYCIPFSPLVLFASSIYMLSLLSEFCSPSEIRIDYCVEEQTWFRNWISCKNIINIAWTCTYTWITCTHLFNWCFAKETLQRGNLYWSSFCLDESKFLVPTLESIPCSLSEVIDQNCGWMARTCSALAPRHKEWWVIIQPRLT